MNPRLFALLLGGIAAALAQWGEAGPMGAKLRGIVAPDAPPESPRYVTVIETPAPPTPLDAALILRAVQRFGPRGITFFDPLNGEDGRALLEAKRTEMTIPVQFAAPSRNITSPSRNITAPASEPGPASEWIQIISFDRLMIRADRTERGEIAADLDNLFHDRWVAVQTSGGRGAPELAHAWNPTTPPTYFPALAMVAVLFAASTPWWIKGRLHRATVALVITGAWVGAALLLGREHIALPLLGMLALPVLALIPPPLPSPTPPT